MAEILKISIGEPNQIFSGNLEKTTQKTNNEWFACKINEIRKKQEVGDRMGADELIKQIIDKFADKLSIKASKYILKNNPLISREDLIQEGIMGIMQAIEEYDGKGEFAAWAVTDIRRKMIDFIRDNDAVVNGIGAKRMVAYSDKKRVKKSYSGDNGISDKAIMLLDRYKAAKNPVYLDKNVADENSTIGDFLASKSNHNNHLLRVDEKKIINEALEILTSKKDRIGSGLPTDWPRNIEIIKCYFGLCDEGQLNEKQIAEKFGITEAGVSYVLKKTKQEIKKLILLRHPDFSL